MLASLKSILPLKSIEPGFHFQWVQIAGEQVNGTASNHLLLVWTSGRPEQNCTSLRYCRSGAAMCHPYIGQVVKHNLTLNHDHVRLTVKLSCFPIREID